MVLCHCLRGQLYSKLPREQCVCELEEIKLVSLGKPTGHRSFQDCVEVSENAFLVVLVKVGKGSSVADEVGQSHEGIERNQTVKDAEGHLQIAGCGGVVEKYVANHGENAAGSDEDKLHHIGVEAGTSG